MINVFSSAKDSDQDAKLSVHCAPCPILILLLGALPDPITKWQVRLTTGNEPWSGLGSPRVHDVQFA